MFIITARQTSKLNEHGMLVPYHSITYYGLFHSYEEAQDWSDNTTLDIAGDYETYIVNLVTDFIPDYVDHQEVMSNQN